MKDILGCMLSCFGKNDMAAQSLQKHMEKQDIETPVVIDNFKVINTPHATLSDHSERLSRDILKSCDVLKGQLHHSSSTINVCFEEFKKDINEMIRVFCESIIVEIKREMCNERKYSLQIQALTEQVSQLQSQKNVIEQQYTMVLTGNGSRDGPVSCTTMHSSAGGTTRYSSHGSFNKIRE